MDNIEPPGSASVAQQDAASRSLRDISPIQANEEEKGPISPPASPRGSAAFSTYNQETKAEEMPPVAHAPYASIADDSTYPSDIRENPVTDHRRNAIDAGDSTALPNPAESDSSNHTVPFTPGYKRNTSSKEVNFPDSLTERLAGLKATKTYTPSHKRNRSRNNDFESLGRVVSHQSHNSMGTTAVNTTRRTSVASDEQIEEVDDWTKLREIIDRAGSGVVIKLNLSVTVGEPRPVAGSGGEEVAEKNVGGELQAREDLIWTAIFMFLFDGIFMILKIALVLLIVTVVVAFAYIVITSIASLLDNGLLLQFLIRGSQTPFRDAGNTFQLLHWDSKSILWVILRTLAMMFVGLVVWWSIEWCQWASGKVRLYFAVREKARLDREWNGIQMENKLEMLGPGVEKAIMKGVNERKRRKEAKKQSYNNEEQTIT
jgi:hypothetical protein